MREVRRRGGEMRYKGGWGGEGGNIRWGGEE